MNWSHGWGLVAQILACLIVVGFVAAPAIGRLLRNARNRCASPESAPGEAVGSSPARALHPAIVKSDSRWNNPDEAFANEVDQPRRVS